MFIGLCGFKGSGKSTIAKHLVDKHKFVETTFSGPLKDIVAILYGFDRNMLNGDTPKTRIARETLRDPIWNRTGREALQFVGTEIFRKHHDTDTWSRIAKRNIVNLLIAGNNVVVSDLRFSNEYDLIKRNGGQIWRVDRHEYTIEEISNMHSSEKTFLEFTPDLFIPNYTTIEELLTFIEEQL